jgi:hypothetical protein
MSKFKTTDVETGRTSCKDSLVANPPRKDEPPKHCPSCCVLHVPTECPRLSAKSMSFVVSALTKPAWLKP